MYLAFTLSAQYLTEGCEVLSKLMFISCWTAHGYIISGVDGPLNEQDAVVVAVLCAVLQPILIAVQWPSLSVPVLACRALFLQIRRNRLLPRVEREICQSPHSSVAAGSPTNQ